MDQTNIHAAKRVCRICRKEFRSGKALGGHMRIHAPCKKKEEDAEDIGRVIMDIHHHHNHSCVVCGKDFPSRKSLYGHMRCHPGRGWKGVTPPSFYSYSASMDFMSLDGSGAVDLTASLKGWPVKAERGRRAMASSEEVSSSSPVDVDLMDAVRYLLMLSSGGDSLVKKKEEQDDINRRSDGGWRRLCDGEFESGTNRNKRRRLKKKVKLSQLEMSEYVVISLPGEDKYKCDMCDRSFSSHQAYGGHRSSHNKMRTFVRDSSSGQSNEALSSRVAASPMWPRGLGFDLNEVPPMSGFELL